MKLFRASQRSVVHAYRSCFDVKSISSMTSEDFSEVYWYSGLQALSVTVFQTSVDLLCKKSYESSSLLGYFDCSVLSNHIVGCCNIIGNAEAFPILCMRYIRWERERDTERERRKWRHHCRAKIGNEFCTSPCQNVHLSIDKFCAVPCQTICTSVSPPLVLGLGLGLGFVL